MMCLLRKHTGFTLIELVLTIVLLGFVSLILIPFVQSISHSPDPMLRQRAVALGQALMDEILAKRWDENTPVGGGPICTGESGQARVESVHAEGNCSDPAWQASSIQSVAVDGSSADGGEPTRASFDDIDDYNGFSETGTFRNQNNDVVANLPGYTCRVTVRYIPSNTNPIEATNPADKTAASDATDTKRIVVTVTSSLNETFTLVVVSCNF